MADSRRLPAANPAVRSAWQDRDAASAPGEGDRSQPVTQSLLAQTLAQAAAHPPHLSRASTPYNRALPRDAGDEVGSPHGVSPRTPRKGWPFSGGSAVSGLESKAVPASDERGAREGQVSPISVRHVGTAPHTTEAATDLRRDPSPPTKRVLPSQAVEPSARRWYGRGLVLALVAAMISGVCLVAFLIAFVRITPSPSDGRESQATHRPPTKQGERPR
jgi:hypothetical protein